jgi:proteasome lid subunit RPN8/RPN11
MPSINIPRDVYNKIIFYVDNCDKEISGMGTVEFIPDENEYRVLDVCLLEQEVGSAHTDLDSKAVSKAMYELHNSKGELSFWWHSHVNMQAFWSGTDEKTIEEIGREGLCVAVVFNKKEECRGAICIGGKGKPFILLDDVEVTTTEQINSEVKNTWLKEIKEKVKEKTYNYNNTYYRGTYQQQIENWEWSEDKYYDTPRAIKQVNNSILSMNSNGTVNENHKDKKEDKPSEATPEYIKKEYPELFRRCKKAWGQMPSAEKMQYGHDFENFLWEEYYFYDNGYPSDVTMGMGGDT